MPARQPFAIGTRVTLPRGYENYPDVRPLPAGITGTVVEEHDDRTHVKLDQHVADLDEWENVLHVWRHDEEEADLIVEVQHA